MDGWISPPGKSHIHRYRVTRRPPATAATTLSMSSIKRRRYKFPSSPRIAIDGDVEASATPSQWRIQYLRYGFRFLTGKVHFDFESKKAEGGISKRPLGETRYQSIEHAHDEMNQQMWKKERNSRQVWRDFARTLFQVIKSLWFICVWIELASGSICGHGVAELWAAFRRFLPCCQRVASLMSFSGIVGWFPWNIETDVRGAVISNETVDRLCSDFTRFLIVVECCSRWMVFWGLVALSCCTDGLIWLICRDVALWFADHFVDQKEWQMRGEKYQQKKTMEGALDDNSSI